MLQEATVGSPAPFGRPGTFAEPFLMLDRTLRQQGGTDETAVCHIPGPVYDTALDCRGGAFHVDCPEK